MPRDEEFSEIKNLSFYSHAIYTVLHAILPALDTLVDKDLAFDDMKDIDKLFTRFKFPRLQGMYLTRLLNAILHFETPDTKKRKNKFFLYHEKY